MSDKFVEDETKVETELKACDAFEAQLLELEAALKPSRTVLESVYGKRLLEEFLKEPKSMRVIMIHIYGLMLDKALAAPDVDAEKDA